MDIKTDSPIPSNAVGKPFEPHITQRITSKDQTTAHQHPQPNLWRFFSVCRGSGALSCWVHNKDSQSNHEKRSPSVPVLRKLSGARAAGHAEENQDLWGSWQGKLEET
ncbi:hypothetical protein EYF80_000907 [Liparis tanakae]|uniref:Uncharacterized protein n=1 Tax=Liparis tanakae TaxID=230148 RepID=A0A4Z2JH97_9TELE|nr:hypothetical protein EYF80_000907 [Liparis tanakae]